MNRAGDPEQARRVAAIEGLLSADARADLAAALVAEAEAARAEAAATIRRDAALAVWEAYLATAHPAPEIARPLAAGVAGAERQLAIAVQAHRDAAARRRAAKDAETNARVRAEAARSAAARVARLHARRREERQLADRATLPRIEAR